MSVHSRGFGVQLSVFRALLVRDAMRRFGHENLGFFWVILEPLMFASGVAIVWTVTGSENRPGISTVALALTGYIMIVMWRHIVGHSIHVFKTNLALRYHSNVKLLDIFLANSLLEVLACLAAFYVAYIPLSVLGVIDPMRDPLTAMGGFWLQAWFCMSFGLVMASLAVMSDVLERVLPVTLYLTLPLTGVFHMQAWLPQKARDIIGWSPMVNTVEMFRNGMFSADLPTYWDAWYVVWCCFGLNVAGLLLLDYIGNRLEMEG